MKICDGGEVIVLTDGCFDAVALGADDTLVLVRAGGVFGELVDSMAEIPDPLLLCLRIEIDQGDFFGGWHKWHRAARLDLEAKTAVLAARDVSAEKSGSLRIVEVGQRLDLNVFHGAVGEHGFELAFRNIRALAYLAAKVLQRLGGARFGARGACGAADLLVGIVGETEHELAEAFLNRILVEDALQLIGFGPVGGL